MRYAVYRDGQRVSKFYENRLAAIIDAYEQHLVVDCGRFGKCFVDGVKIRNLTKLHLVNNAALDYAKQYELGA